MELKGDDLANREYYVGITQFKAQLKKKEIQTGYKLGTGYGKGRDSWLRQQIRRWLWQAV